MQIIVHRGTNQIGGCATEIATAKARIFIDFGAELNGNSNLDIDGVTKGNTNCSAIFFTHYHGDHIGLINSINKDIPCYIGSLSIDILKIQNNRTKFIEPERLSNIRPYYAGKAITIEDITITPYSVDHSAFDAHMFLIEADGKRILHTGDFRTHGFRGKGLTKVIDKYIGAIDALICEGTTMSRSPHTSETEYALSQKLRPILKENKYVFVACSSTNIDRLAAFHSAVPSGKYCICDRYQKEIVDVVKEKSQHYSELYAFNKMLFYSKNLDHKLEDRGFVMFVRLGNPMFERFMEKYKDKNPLLIYSMWHGYIDEQPKIKNAMDTYRSVEMHTSGHADFESIKMLIEATHPKKVIPIHTENAGAFTSISNSVILPKDKETIFI